MHEDQTRLHPSRKISPSSQVYLGGGLAALWPWIQARAVPSVPSLAAGAGGAAVLQQPMLPPCSGGWKPFPVLHNPSAAALAHA